MFKNTLRWGEMSPFCRPLCGRDVPGLRYAGADLRPGVPCSGGGGGVSRKEFLERRISAQLEEIIEQRRIQIAVAGDQKRTQPVEGIERYAAVTAPLWRRGDGSARSACFCRRPAPSPERAM